MRNLMTLVLAAGLVFGNLYAPDVVCSQEKADKAEKAERSKEKKKDSAEKGKKKDAQKGTGVRLPRFFAAIVDDAQREKILAIRTKHHAKLEDLRKQLAALEKQEMDEIEDVLTPAQRKQLDSLKSEGAKADPPKEKGKPKVKK